jgi:hypothetical protein
MIDGGSEDEDADADDDDAAAGWGEAGMIAFCAILAWWRAR